MTISAMNNKLLCLVGIIYLREPKHMLSRLGPLAIYIMTSHCNMCIQTILLPTTIVEFAACDVINHAGTKAELFWKT